MLINTRAFRVYMPFVILFLLASTRVYSFLSSGATVETTLPMPVYARKITSKLTYNAQSSLPKVDADLLLGMTIGVDSIKTDKEFYQMLITSGLVHVVVVSGYNVALVIKFITSLFNNRLKVQNRWYVLIFLTAYVIICGMQPPVIRAALMGYVAYLATIEGRGVQGLLLLVFVCLFMLIVFPSYVISLSFWLSTSATLGLMLFQTKIQGAINSFFDVFGKAAKLLPLEDLASSLACQITVWPIISYFFGRLSLLSPIYNMLVLWLIPMCTVLGFVFLLITAIIPHFAAILVYLVHPFYDTFIQFVTFFAYVDRSNIGLKIDLRFFILYYLGLTALVLLYGSLSPENKPKILIE